MREGDAGKEESESEDVLMTAKTQRREEEEPPGMQARLRDIEAALPIGYTLIDTPTLRHACELIALEFGAGAEIVRRIHSAIKEGVAGE